MKHSIINKLARKPKNHEEMADWYAQFVNSVYELDEKRDNMNIIFQKDDDGDDEVMCEVWRDMQKALVVKNKLKAARKVKKEVGYDFDAEED